MVSAVYLVNQAGWVAAETGRQPWVVYKLLRTSEGVRAARQHLIANRGQAERADAFAAGVFE